MKTEIITTTLKRIRARRPCEDGWKMLLAHLGKTSADDEPLPFAVILKSNGLDDALWCMRAEPQHSREWRLLAVRYARRVQHLMTDPRSLAALDVAERHAGGMATDEELDAAWAAAWAAAWDAELAVTRSAAASVTRSAAASVAQSIARSAAQSIAWSAACAVAMDAGRCAAWDAVHAAERDAARVALSGFALTAKLDAAWAAGLAPAEAEMSVDFLAVVGDV